MRHLILQRHPHVFIGLAGHTAMTPSATPTRRDRPESRRPKNTPRCYPHSLSHTAPELPSTGPKSTIGLRRPNHRSKDDRSRKADGQRVGMVVESKMLKSSKSFMDVRRTIEESAFGAVRMLERVENRRGLEDGYAFGRPSDLKEGRVEEYNRTFKDIAHVGHQVTDTLKASEKDKRNFSAYRTQRTVTTTSGPEKVKADSIPANSTRKQERTVSIWQSNRK
ncbi:hypothetical protein DFJ73DRAFT_430034 [Zopfochytrium polystomum]|nr:hypothetical protein DFJ73DRAFT_430034 [Zopfochytrium polystomum]